MAGAPRDLSVSPSLPLRVRVRGVCVCVCVSVGVSHLASGCYAGSQNVTVDGSCASSPGHGTCQPNVRCHTGPLRPCGWPTQDFSLLFYSEPGAPHSHLLPCHSFSRTNLKSPGVEQARTTTPRRRGAASTPLRQWAARLSPSPVRPTSTFSLVTHFLIKI